MFGKNKGKSKPKKTSSSLSKKSRANNSSSSKSSKLSQKKGKQNYKTNKNSIVGRNQNSSPTHKRRELRNVTIDTYDVDQSHLSKGTKTTSKTRKHVNDPKTKRPIKIEGYSKAGKESHSVRVDNPPSSKDDAGHILGRQNGGRGDLPSHVMPQSPEVNRGLNRKRAWREYEDNTNKAIKKENKGKVTIKQIFKLNFSLD